MAKFDDVTCMMIEECVKKFDISRSSLKVTVPEGSDLRALAESGLEMIDCYRNDTDNFVKMEEYVTAFAAINYAHSWIGCFTELGLFESAVGDELFKELPGDESPSEKITDQKMAKYLDITTRARKKLNIASPVRSFDRRLAIGFLETSESYFKEAVSYRNDGDFIRAFASVNYSHAWLDAGARIGLFDVEEDDVLFTLYE